MTDTTATARFELGRVLQLATGALGRNIGPFALLALLCVGLPDLLIGLVALGSKSPVASAGNLVSTIGQCILQGAVVQGVVSDLNGRPASFSACLKTGGQVFLPLWGLSVVIGVGVVLGLLVFIVPGVILACLWSVATPARVVEGKGVRRAMGRSRTLTKGHRGAIFLLGLVMFVAVVAVYGAGLGGVEAAIGPQSPVSLLLLDPVLSAAVALIFTVVTASLYYELRRVKEGVSPDALAAVFD